MNKIESHTSSDLCIEDVKVDIPKHRRLIRNLIATFSASTMNNALSMMKGYAFCMN
jgi:hypothetical protein